MTPVYLPILRTLVNFQKILSLCAEAGNGAEGYDRDEEG